MFKLIVKNKLILIFYLFTLSIVAQNIKTKPLKLYGDVRIRAEQDWNSKKTDGSMRKDRTRLRYRLRFGFKYNWNQNIEFGGRIISGNPKNQQSPHVSFGNEFESSSVSIDKVYLKYKKNSFWAWAGKNSFPFWKQNELFWDDDVNPEGVALGANFKLNDSGMKLTTSTGYFIPNNSAQLRGDQARSFGVQLNLINNSENNSYVLSSGLFSFNDLPNTPDNTATFVMDYTIWNASLKFKFNKMPLSFGFDYLNNLEDYAKNTNISPVFVNETDGYVVNMTYGNSKKKGDVQIGYYYSSIGKYAVVDYFAQDDWVCWGNTNFTRSSNFKGSEIRLKYTIGPKFNVVLRSYFVEAIKTIGTTLESGNRLRLDFNIKF